MNMKCYFLGYVHIQLPLNHPNKCQAKAMLLKITTSINIGRDLKFSNFYPIIILNK